MGKNPQKKDTVEGVIKGLVRELEKLAPHPGRLSGAFNHSSARHALEAYLRDLPVRQGLERRISQMRHFLNTPMPELAAA